MAFKPRSIQQCIDEGFLQLNPEEPTYIEPVDGYDVVFINKGGIFQFGEINDSKVTFWIPCGPDDLNEHNCTMNQPLFNVFKTTQV